MRRLRGAFAVHVIATSLERTGFGELPGRAAGEPRAGAPGRVTGSGGHLVQGHVDGVGRMRRIARAGRRAAGGHPRAARRSPRPAIPLGSITVDGVSLTVNALPGPDVVQISLIPFTLQHTTLGDRRVGDRVHLEGDTLGKYVAALPRPRRGRARSR